MAASLIILEVGIAAALWAWAWIIWKWRRGEPLLRLELRQQVPWSAVDLLIVIATLLLAQTACLQLGLWWTGTTLPNDLEQLDSQQQMLVLTSHFAGSILTIVFGIGFVAIRSAATPLDLGINLRRAPFDLRCGVIAFTAAAPIVFALQALLTQWLMPYEHPVIEALEKHPGGWSLAMLVVSTVVVAPLVEEFLFRVLLQGWLEKVEVTLLARTQNSLRAPNRMAGDCPNFAESAEQNGTVPFSEAILLDALSQPESSPSDEVAISTGPAGFSPGFLPIIISSFLFSLMHYGQGPAIVPLFVFALVLGYLYRQTHRLLPSLTVHVLLNAVSLVMLFAQPNPA